MMDVKALFIVVPILLFVWIYFDASSAVEKQKEADIKKKSDALQAEADLNAAEIEFANNALAMLPDVESALNLLREKYGWRELVETLRVGALQLDILRMLRGVGAHHIRLPNMQSDRYEADERYLNRVVRKTTPSYEDVNYYGVDAFAQQPTAEMLRDLINNTSYVSVRTPISKNSRDFECELTPNGRALMMLDAIFCRGDSSKSFLRRAPSCKEAEKIIGELMYRCVLEVQKKTDGENINSGKP